MPVPINSDLDGRVPKLPGYVEQPPLVLLKVKRGEGVPKRVDREVGR